MRSGELEGWREGEFVMTSAERKTRGGRRAWAALGGIFMALAVVSAGLAQSEAGQDGALQDAIPEDVLRQIEEEENEIQQEAMEAAKRALGSGGRYPWYDRAKDDVRPLNVVPRNAEGERGEQWIDDSKPQARPVTTRPRVSLFGGVLSWIGLTALILLLGLIAYLIVTTFLKDEVSESVSVRKVVNSRRDADRVEALPFQLRAAEGDFLAEARRLYEQGQYSAAIVYLFSHQLVELDKRHFIRLAKGKTNRQYLRETRRQPTIAGILEGTMIAFEDAFFGHKTLSRESFERCWRQQEQFQSELERQERTAA